MPCGKVECVNETCKKVLKQCETINGLCPECHAKLIKKL